MLFPIPHKIQYSDGSYQPRRSYLGYDLFTFADLIKAGNEDVTIIPLHTLEKEEYLLSVCETGAVIRASCDEGIFRAATTLWQLLRDHAGRFPYVVIKDKPDFERRGYMLDISRGRKPRMEAIKQMVDFMAALKYNEFQLYMEGECFKYAAYPKYTEHFDCLTPEDIKELDRYCKSRYIDLVPNQNSFGHLTHWLKHEEFRPLGLYEGDDTPNTLNPLLPESYEFVRNLYDSVLPNFTSEYVNIGLDEAYGLGRFQIEEYCREHGKETVFMEWLNKLNALAKGHDKKVMFWSDMIYKSERLYDMIPKDAVVLEWGYELIQSQMMAEHCIAFKNAGLNYYVCPATNGHCSFCGRSDVTTFNIRTAAELGLKYGAKGILLTDWGNLGHPQFGVWSMNPVALCSQYAWNAGDEQNGENFKADYIRSAEKYVDDMMFGGAPVSRLLYKICNYYLLEPERVHVGTMSAELFPYPLAQTNYAHIFDLMDSGEIFYFDNVTDYVTRVMDDIEKLDFDERMKREVLINCNMVLMAAELCKVKLGKQLTNDEIDALLDLARDMREEFYELWCFRNYEHGVERFQGQLDMHIRELEEMKK